MTDDRIPVSTPSGSGLNLEALLEAQKTAILTAVNEKISGLEATLQNQQQELAINTSQNQVAAPPTFKKKGNEHQFKFNEKVIACHKQASKALELKNIARAKELLEQGTVLLNNRQKLTKIADKSEFGCATIQEYVDDELADNEADAKKIKKAEKRAGERSKAAAVKKKKLSKPSAQTSSSQRYMSHNMPYNNYGSYFRPQGSRFNWSSRPTMQRDLCFRCGKRGHWADSCSRISNGSNSSGSK
ncbi:uncharacterized protein LOC110247825 [Exaiptasia diaphana]|uniref:CCHC-type domain-containing protein n=1 Tax=Exaiptasia diaphana TaxID=2652724 RepID=A0A913XTE4_EXADI|nr:uncharacterized protein LOC110247825 [Exaiptasia diaphana]